MKKHKVIAITYNGFEGAAATAVLPEKRPKAELLAAGPIKTAQWISQRRRLT